MSAATAGRHALLPEPKPRRRLRLLPRRRPAAPAIQPLPGVSPGEHPYPESDQAVIADAMAAIREPAGASREVLQHVLDGLRSLPGRQPEPSSTPGPGDDPAAGTPGAWLGVRTADGRLKCGDALTSRPALAGTFRDTDGQLFAGVYITGEDPDGRFVLDAASAEWFRDLSEAAAQAAALLEGAHAPRETAGAAGKRRAAQLTHCWAVWRRASELPEAGGVPAALTALYDAIGQYGEIVNGLDPVQAFPHVAGMPDPESAAVEAAIGLAEDAADRVILAVAAEHGQDVADQIAGRAIAHPPVPAREPDKAADDGGPGSEDSTGAEAGVASAAAEVPAEDPEPASQAGGAL